MSNRQIDPGTYNIMQNGSQVGTCYVAAGAELDTTVEHWCLYSGFVSPRIVNGNPVDNMVLKRVPAADLTPRAATIRANGVQSLADFFAIMRDHASYYNLTIRYDRSNCTLFDNIPASP